MRILYYNELDYSRVSKNFKKIEKFLAEGNFRSAEVKRMINTDFYRAKLDDTNRLLFKFAKYEGNTYLLLLEVILNHEYEKSRFLRGAKIDDEKFTIIEQPAQIESQTIQELKYVNQKQKHFHILDKFVSLDDEQSDIYNLPSPLIVIGSAGSGKTILTLEKIKTLKGRIAYISLSQFLVESAQNIYYSNNYENEGQEVDFLSFREFYQSIEKPQGAELQYRHFENWYSKYMVNSKIKESFKLFEEFKGVLTGSIVDKPYLTRDEYINLGVRQSIFLKEQREDVYKIFEKYIEFLTNSAFFDTNILSYNYLCKVEKNYDFIIIDEVQDITNVQLKLILNSLKIQNNFILSGDSNQIVHPNFFSWSKIKSMFYSDHTNDATIYRILKTNYRNSKNVTDLSNNLIKIKNLRFGSIDRESTYLINSISNVNGEIHLLDDNNKIKNELNSKTQLSTKYAILVMNQEDKKYAKEFFKTPLIFSIQEAKGLEYENIILVNFISNYEKEFHEIAQGVEEEMLYNEMIYSRAKNKEDKDLEVYKFYINSLYVAFTRSIKNIFIIEKNRKAKILQLLRLQETLQAVKMETQKSNDEDWLEEARKLELQGKTDQAQEIRDKIMGIDYISPEELKNMQLIALDPTKKELKVKRERKIVFKYAEARKTIEIIDALAKLNFQRAVIYMKDVHKLQKDLIKDCRADRLTTIPAITKKYGIDFRSDIDNMTGLMLSCSLGATNLFNYYIKNHANVNLTNLSGQNALQISFVSFFNWVHVDSSRKNNYINPEKMSLFYNKLKPLYIKYEVDNKIYKINGHSMEFFLINFMNVAGHYFKTKFARTSTGITMDNFMTVIDEITDGILPEYRRKRTYVNAYLANNECEKETGNSKKIFLRTSRGTYILNPKLKFIVE